MDKKDNNNSFTYFSGGLLSTLNLFNGKNLNRIK
jgi:hypothetical protein